MDILRILANIIAVLALYNSIAAPAFELLCYRKNISDKSSNQIKRQGKSISKKLQVLAIVILLFLLLLSLCLVPDIAVFILVVPGLLMFVTSTLSAAQTAARVTAVSKDIEPLSEVEDWSFGFLGLLLFLACDSLATVFQIKTHTTFGALGSYALSAAIYSIYIFMLVALAVHPLKDISKAILWCAARVANKYNGLMKEVGTKADSEVSRVAYLERIIPNLKMSNGLKRIAWAVFSMVTFVVDIILFIIFYAIKMFFWLPLFCILSIAKMVVGIGPRIARSLCAISSRQVIAISFRIAIVIAILIVVIQNRLMVVSDSSESITAILEFVASVIIIPILFDWIHKFSKAGKNI